MVVTSSFSSNWLQFGQWDGISWSGFPWSREWPQLLQEASPLPISVVVKLT